MTNTFETSEQMNGGAVPPRMNHGGHELLDMHEVLGSMTGALNKAVLLRPHVKDPDLLDILDRQHAFMLDEYNMTVESLSTGKNPSHGTKRYQMKEQSDFIYGMKDQAPVKPMQTADEITDEIISGFLLSSAKAGAAGKAAAAAEICNPVVRRVVADSIPNCLEMAYELSIYQNKRQFYQIPQLQEQDMNRLMNAFAPAGSTQPPLQ